MTERTSYAPQSIDTRLMDIFAVHWKGYMAAGAVVMVLGLLAVAMPVLSTFAIETFLGWLFLVSGILRTFVCWRARHIPGVWLAFFGALLGIVIGLALIVLPAAGMFSLTVLLIALFSIEGIVAIVSAFDFRRHAANWVWVLIGGLVNLVLAWLIWSGLPETAAWAIGVLAGVNMLFGGLVVVLIALTARSHFRDRSIA